MRKIPLVRKIFVYVTLLILLVACEAGPQTPSPTADSPAVEQPTSTVMAEPTVIATEAAVEPQETVDVSKYEEYDIITLLPKDAIPAIDDPTFLTAAEADEEYEPEELVLGVFINDEARAYSVPHLSTHEIVNDTVGGRKISVTW